MYMFTFHYISDLVCYQCTGESYDDCSAINMVEHTCASSKSTFVFYHDIKFIYNTNIMISFKSIVGKTVKVKERS